MIVILYPFISANDRFHDDAHKKTNYYLHVGFSMSVFRVLLTIITLIGHTKTGSTAKCMVRNKKARFDTQMPCSTKNTLPSMCQLALPLSNIPPILSKLFLTLIKSFVLKNPYIN